MCQHVPAAPKDVWLNAPSRDCAVIKNQSTSMNRIQRQLEHVHNMQ